MGDVVDLRYRDVPCRVVEYVLASAEGQHRFDVSPDEYDAIVLHGWAEAADFLATLVMVRRAHEGLATGALELLQGCRVVQDVPELRVEVGGCQ